MKKIIPLRLASAVVVALTLLWLLAACAPAATNPPAVEDPGEPASAVAVVAPTTAPTAVPLVSPPASPTAAPVDTPTSTPPAATEAAVAAEAATVEAVVEDSPTNSSTPETAATGEEETVIATFGRTADGAFFRGREDAPVTIIDYSDFL